MTSEQIGRVVGGRYRLVSRLAVGGMGVTYRAWDLRRSCPVVLKMPRRPVHDPDGEEYARLAARFVREIEAMRALSHDYIVPIVDHGIDEGTPFVAMRFLPGGSLAEDRKAAAGGEWQPVAAGLLHFWLPSIAGALDFMHSKGVVHRDVKPANIFFDGFRNPFLGDFGIAKVVGDDGGLEKGQTLTATHLAIGTPEYMAPELLSPKSVPDGRADQYALAISVYELLSGRRPFTGSTAHIVVEHATLPAPPLDTRSLGIPRSLAAAVERALSKRPGERFGSCREFAEAALGGVTPEPNDPSVVRLVCPGCRKVLRVPAAAGGRRGNCPSCREVVEIAEDFSALWLRSQAALVAEPSPESGPVPVLGLFGEAGGAVGSDRGASELQAESLEASPASEPAGRGWSGAAVATVTGGAALLAALLGGLATHLVWSGHHGRTMQAEAAEREQERTGHAQAVAKAEAAKAAAVAAAEEEWRARLAAEEADWEKELAAAEEARRKSEEKLVAIDREAKQAEVARLEAEREAAAREAAKPKPFSELTNSIGIKMVLIPEGTFTMGDEQYGPAHKVTLTKPFYIGVTEITNGQWRAVMGDDRGEPERPVTGIDWDDAVEYCRRLSAQAEERAAKRVYRLPTEAEWEHACRAGTTTAYSFANDVGGLEDHAWFAVNSPDGPRTVGQKKPNAWGLHDMHGNVWEWVHDRYGAYQGEPATDPLGSQQSWGRCSRGGSWRESATTCRSAMRVQRRQDHRDDSVGLRIALNLQPASTSSQVLSP